MLAPQISTCFIFTCLSSLFLTATLLEFFPDLLFKAPHTPYHYLTLSQELVNAGKCLTTPGWGESLICNICSRTPRSTSCYRLWSHWRQRWERLTTSSHHLVQTGSAHYCRWRRGGDATESWGWVPCWLWGWFRRTPKEGETPGEGIFYRNRELSAFLLFHLLLGHLSLQVLSTPWTSLCWKANPWVPFQTSIWFFCCVCSGLVFDPLFFFALTCVPSSADPPGWQDRHVLRPSCTFKAHEDMGILIDSWGEEHLIAPFFDLIIPHTPAFEGSGSHWIHVILRQDQWTVLHFQDHLTGLPRPPA